jgi:TctA family transporter
MLQPLIDALFILLDPFRMGMLFLGVGIGIVVGILPGLGGLMGMALVLPFLFGMDSFAGIAMLVGIAAAVPSSDIFPSVLMGIPGSSGSQAAVGSLYLFDGSSLIIVARGLFAIPEVVDLLARGGAIAQRRARLGSGWLDRVRHALP